MSRGSVILWCILLAGCSVAPGKTLLLSSPSGEVRIITANADGVTSAQCRKLPGLSELKLFECDAPERGAGILGNAFKFILSLLL